MLNLIFMLVQKYLKFKRFISRLWKIIKY